eukprot:9688663-Karenia_brevis.AAC.1
MFLGAWCHLGSILGASWSHLEIMWGEFQSIGGFQVGPIVELDLDMLLMSGAMMGYVEHLGTGLA